MYVSSILRVGAASMVPVDAYTSATTSIFKNATIMSVKKNIKFMLLMFSDMKNILSSISPWTLATPAGKTIKITIHTAVHEAAIIRRKYLVRGIFVPETPSIATGIILAFILVLLLLKNKEIVQADLEVLMI